MFVYIYASFKCWRSTSQVIIILFMWFFSTSWRCTYTYIYIHKYISPCLSTSTAWRVMCPSYFGMVFVVLNLPRQTAALPNRQRHCCRIIARGFLGLSSLLISTSRVNYSASFLLSGSTARVSCFWHFSASSLLSGTTWRVSCFLELQRECLAF